LDNEYAGMSNDRKPASLKSRRCDLEAAPAVVTL
jgi:hypothetical protein